MGCIELSLQRITSAILASEESILWAMCGRSYRGSCKSEGDDRANVLHDECEKIESPYLVIWLRSGRYMRYDEVLRGKSSGPHIFSSGLPAPAVLRLLEPKFSTVDSGCLTVGKTT